MMRVVLKHPLRFITDHRFTRAHASHYVDDTLDGTARKRIEAHTHVCPACMRFLTTLLRTVTALHSLRMTYKETPQPSHIADSVLTRLRSLSNAEAPPTTGEPRLNPEGS